MGDDTYLIALNCGSSSIKGRLYVVPHSKKEKFEQQATLSVSNIGAPGEPIHFTLKWSDNKGKDMDIHTDDGGSVERESQRLPRTSILYSEQSPLRGISIVKLTDRQGPVPAHPGPPVRLWRCEEGPDPLRDAPYCARR